LILEQDLVLKIHTVTKTISNALDNGDKAFVIFLDLAKAFDTVDHALLCNVLPDFSSNGISLLWFQNYLQNRTQC